MEFKEYLGPGMDDKATFYMGGEEGSQTGSELSSSEETDMDDEEKVIIVGICSMDKKCKSKPMQEILDRLARFEYIKTLVMEERVILKEPVENWPICDCLVSFHSKGFSLDKAVKYAELRRVMLVNDLHMQYIIQDRVAVHRILAEQGVDQPSFAVLDRNAPNYDGNSLVETDDHIEIHGEIFQKPFVEKPVSAEDHNVYIYFPTSAGGGSQRLFRKIGSRSSVYSPVSTVRKTGSYIYEEFMPTDGTDVKVYTVGPDYAHAEARKSPALDGKVERDKDGKEVRYPVILTGKEKLIARKVCLAFKQAVCGFDLLRANGKSYVCDVNGFSFVKTSPKYYDDCAKILGNMVLRTLAPQLHIPYSITYQPEDIPIVPTTYGTMMELRCVTAVIRHGDRTPKQKMKMEVRHKKFFDLFEKYGGYKTGHMKLKRPKQLQEVLDIARFLLAEIKAHADEEIEIEEKKTKLEQLKAVLEMYGHFSGINRKVQFKYQPNGAPKKSSSEDEDSDYSSVSEGPREPSLVLILKWGGELTPAGKIQAEELGKAFRCMYPGGQGDYGHSPGLGLLRLHSTFRHDLKIYASDEGRVQMTAAAFAKGFLALEGELPPILAQMVKSANMNGLLDNDNESPKYQNIIKEKLQGFLNLDQELEDINEKLIPTKSKSLSSAADFVKNPRQACDKIYEMLLSLIEKIRELMVDPKAGEMKLYHSESWELMLRRWSKLMKDFKLKTNQYNISKIPDIYDCIKYDLQHNMKILRFSQADELHSLSKALADIVIPQEYGITKDEKLMIGQCICTPLLRKILADLQTNLEEESTRLDYRYLEGVSNPHRHVRTRLYFTSESHIHALLNILRYGGFCNPEQDEQWARAMAYVNRVSELNYMTQIVIMMYEDPTKDPSSDERFHVELHFSPGAYCSGENKKKDPESLGYRSQLGEKQAKEKEKESLKKQQLRDVSTCPVDLNKKREEIEEKEIEKERSPDHKSTVLDLILSEEFRERKDSAPPDLADVSNVKRDPTTESLDSALKHIDKDDINPTEIVKGLKSGKDVNVVPKTGIKSDCVKSDTKIESKIEPPDLKIVSLSPLAIKPDSPLQSCMIKTNSPSEVNKSVSFAPGHVYNTVSDASTVGGTSSRQSDVSLDDVQLSVEKMGLLSPISDTEESVSSRASSNPVDIKGRARHHSGNSIQPHRQQQADEAGALYKSKNGGRASSLEDTNQEELESPGPLSKEDKKSASFEDNLQKPHSKHSREARRTKTHTKRHSFLGVFGPIMPLEGLKIDLKAANLFKGRRRSLISTKVISGSSSAPDLTDVDNVDPNFGGLEGWKVPSIRPLETLHNSLTLKQMESFLKRMTDISMRTPMSSPSRGPSTPICMTPRETHCVPPAILPLPGNPSSTCSSSGPSSPTGMSSAEDIIKRLRQLMERDRDPYSSYASRPSLSSSSSRSQLSSPGSSANPVQLPTNFNKIVTPTPTPPTRAPKDKPDSSRTSKVTSPTRDLLSRENSGGKPSSPLISPGGAASTEIGTSSSESSTASPDQDNSVKTLASEGDSLAEAPGILPS